MEERRMPGIAERQAPPPAERHRRAATLVGVLARLHRDEDGEQAIEVLMILTFGVLPMISAVSAWPNSVPVAVRATISTKTALRRKFMLAASLCTAFVIQLWRRAPQEKREAPNPSLFIAKPWPLAKPPPLGAD